MLVDGTSIASATVHPVAQTSIIEHAAAPQPEGPNGYRYGAHTTTKHSGGPGFMQSPNLGLRNAASDCHESEAQTTNAQTRRSYAGSVE